MLNNLTWPLVDQIAGELGVSQTARWKWRQDGRGVPDKWKIPIVERLRAGGMVVAFADFDALPTTPGRIK